jgi:hypothetical protein
LHIYAFYVNVVVFKAVNKEMLGRGKVNNLVKDNFDFEDWTPIESNNRRSKDFESDVAEDRISYSTDHQTSFSTDHQTTFSTDRHPSTESDLQTRQREARKRASDLNDKYFYPPEDLSSSNSRNENDVSNEIADRPERDCKFIFCSVWLYGKP